MREKGIEHIGYCFDIGHATVEGGLSWPIEARLAEPFDYTSVYMKDFKVWVKRQGRLDPGTGARSGRERLRPSFVHGLAAKKCRVFGSRSASIMSTRSASQAEMIAHMRRDLQVLRDWLAQARGRGPLIQMGADEFDGPPSGWRLFAVRRPVRAMIGVGIGDQPMLDAVLCLQLGGHHHG